VGAFLLQSLPPVFTSERRLKDEQHKKKRASSKALQWRDGEGEGEREGRKGEEQGERAARKQQ
jgi:hypothetical protein